MAWPARARRRWCCADARRGSRGWSSPTCACRDGNGAGIRLEQRRPDGRANLVPRQPAGHPHRRRPARLRSRSTNRPSPGLAPARARAAARIRSISATMARSPSPQPVRSGTRRALRQEPRRPDRRCVNSSFDDVGGRDHQLHDRPARRGDRADRGQLVRPGRDKENYSAFIAVAAEGKSHSSDGSGDRGQQRPLRPRRGPRQCLRGRLVGRCGWRLAAQRAGRRASSGSSGAERYATANAPTGRAWSPDSARCADWRAAGAAPARPP